MFSSGPGKKKIEDPQRKDNMEYALVGIPLAVQTLGFLGSARTHFQTIKWVASFVASVDKEPPDRWQMVEDDGRVSLEFEILSENSETSRSGGSKS